MPQSVQSTQELKRVLDLPRRTPQGLEALARDLTEVLRTPTGTMQLRPLQALALHDLAIYGGLFAPLGVGEGKTLITLLAPHITDARRPLLILPANLIQKTERDRRALSKHWLIPKHLRLMSYQMLGLVQSAAELEVYAPDLIIADEHHKLKHRRTAVTRRITRYMDHHPDTKFVAMTGTVMRKSLTEFAHILRWCLKDGAPVPRTQQETEEWASALDEDMTGIPGVSELSRYEPGALLQLCSAEELQETPARAARLGFRRRLVQTPGVVSSDTHAQEVDCSIYVSAITYDVQRITEDHYAKLRGEWLTPDDWPLTSGADVWRCARELALGLHYKWVPRPPKDWLEPRRAWGAFVRNTLSRSRTLDSELQVAQAVLSGKLDDNGCLAAWHEVRDSFVPNVMPEWHDDSALKLCAKWMNDAPGIVWTEHSLFANRLARETGVPYYGPKGMTAVVPQQFIDDADPKRSAIVSADANREGRNLQSKWSRNLITAMPNAEVLQQIIGRTHRTGQTADEVVVDILLGCTEHAKAFDEMLAASHAIRDTTGAEYKILIADIDWPDTQTFRGARWA